VGQVRPDQAVLGLTGRAGARRMGANRKLASYQHFNYLLGDSSVQYEFNDMVSVAGSPVGGVMIDRFDRTLSSRRSKTQFMQRMAALTSYAAAFGTTRERQERALNSTRERRNQARLAQIAKAQEFSHSLSPLSPIGASSCAVVAASTWRTLVRTAAGVYR
jgi:hypothetical protein